MDLFVERSKHVVVALGLAVILPMLVYYGVSSVIPPPEWRDYTPRREQAETPKSEARDQKETQKLTAFLVSPGKDFVEAKRAFSRALFFVAVPVGLIAIVVGGLLSVPAIGPGLILGGVASLVLGYGRFWSDLENWMRFGSLLVAFVVLILIAWRKFRGLPRQTETEEPSR